MGKRTPTLLVTAVLLAIVLPLVGCSKDEGKAPVGSSTPQEKNEGKGPVGSSTLQDKETLTTFNFEVRFEVFLWDTEDFAQEPKLLGTTPSESALDIPPGRQWLVSPIPPVDMQKVREEIIAKRISGLRLATTNDDDLAHLKGLTGLQNLNLSWCEQITDAGLV